MQPEASMDRRSGPQSPPLAELLRCPPPIAYLLNEAAQSVDVLPTESVFRQGETCKGLYVIVSGKFMRKTERAATPLILGTARAGDLIELAAALGAGLHTYSLFAQVPGSLVMLPIAALHRAFEAHPPMRMLLLQELAREVSRGYDASCLSRLGKTRRRTSEDSGSAVSS
jgi:CRP-like cAMP-binding protein